MPTVATSTFPLVGVTAIVTVKEPPEAHVPLDGAVSTHPDPP